MSDPERRILVTVLGLIVSVLLVAAEAFHTDPYVSYENYVLIRSVYMSAAGIVFILALLPWALTDNSSKAKRGS